VDDTLGPTNIAKLGFNTLESRFRLHSTNKTNL